MFLRISLLLMLTVASLAQSDTSIQQRHHQIGLRHAPIIVQDVAGYRDPGRRRIAEDTGARLPWRLLLKDLPTSVHINGPVSQVCPMFHD